MARGSSNRMLLALALGPGWQLAVEGTHPIPRGHGTSSCLMGTFKELFVQFAGWEGGWGLFVE